MKLLIHSQTSTVQPLPFGTDKSFHTTLYDRYNYLSVLGFKLIHVSKRGPSCAECFYGDRPLIIFHCNFSYMSKLHLQYIAAQRSKHVMQCSSNLKMIYRPSIWITTIINSSQNIEDQCCGVFKYALFLCVENISSVHLSVSRRKLTGRWSRVRVMEHPSPCRTEVHNKAQQGTGNHRNNRMPLGGSAISSQWTGC